MPMNEDVRQMLDRLGIRVPEADLPFLQRARERQVQLLNEWASLVPPDTEPALVLKVEALR